MSFGTGPFGYTPAGVAIPTPDEEMRSTLSSSRSMNFTTGRYLTNDEGGFEAMDDVGQTVTLRVAFGWRPPVIITPQTIAEAETNIRTVLADMAAAPDPLIEILDITIATNGKGTMSPTVTYRNLRTNTLNTVPAR